ncbi:MAG: TrkH family potassium uptake protein, partial [Bdellovibrionales bacterium]|nr:TrkH family potassium uptake protein [Bdellovibrionales bacterium]
SINFSLHFRVLLTRSLKAMWTTEAQWYLSILGIVTIVCTLTIWGKLESTLGFEESFRQSLFTVICTASSTGFTNVDYIYWPVGTHTLILLLMFMGGMSGSTAGGLKCVRFAAAMKQLFKELKKVVHPRALYSIKINDHSVPDDVINAIWGFVFLYVTVCTSIVLVMTFQGVDLLSATSASISALSNIGPALGDFGPYSNYAALPTGSKIALTGGMVLGRLEFYTLIVIFTTEYWRK